MAEHEAPIDAVVRIAALDAVVTERVLAASQRAAAVPVRASDGYVHQHLLVGPLTITELGRRLGVTQQRASAQVSDLEARGFVRIEPDPGDARRRLVHLTDQALAVVEAARAERAALLSEMEALVGPNGWRSFERALLRICDGTGASELIEQRRFTEEPGGPVEPPPSAGRRPAPRRR